MTTVTASGIVAEVEGDGVPVVMIHGLGGTSQHLPAADGGAPRLPGRADRPAGQRAFARSGGRRHRSAASPRPCSALQAARRRRRPTSSAIRSAPSSASRSPPTQPSAVALAGAVRRPRRAGRGDARRARRPAPSWRAREGMAAIADQIVANALSAATRATQPAAVAFVRESLMRQNPEGYARTCEALARAEAVDARLIAAPTLLVTGDADTVNPAERGARRSPTAFAGAAARDGRSWRPLADDREARRMQPMDCGVRQTS